ncbi:BatA domain-containing protein [Sediminitomix flava]|uniref:Putative membrane protein (TIGR02226 family) n=1 Tax=Sediminitomix flava TaxID=379075 RepID=A0A315ZCW1_SEDFL|nr:BatA domain-containing protein [Sediminitomix flava]PWJ42949.1 putative membrane protein (TIGR02226 family) [Sediminitomix flava]
MFQHNTYLWGLSLILIPLLIHLWYRKQGKEIPFGSVRLLMEDKFAKISRLKFNERRLFLLRSAIVMSLIFLIAIPKFPPFQWQQTSNRINLLEAQVSADLAKEFDENQTIILWQKDEIFQRSEAEVKTHTIWQALKMLDREYPQLDTVAVYVRARKQFFEGNTPKLSFHTQWHWIGEKESVRSLVGVFQEKEQVRVWWSEGDENVQNLSSEGFTFEKPYLWSVGGDTLKAVLDAQGNWQLMFKDDKVALEQKPKLKLKVHAAKSYSFEKRRVEAALKAIEAQKLITIQQTDSVADWHIYLGRKATNSHQNSFSILHHKSGLKHIQFEGEGGEWTLSYDAREAKAVIDFEEQLPSILLKLLMADYLNEEAISKADVRHLSEKEKEKIEQLIPIEKQRSVNKNMQIWLWWLVFILIGVERYLAIRKG